MDLLCVLNRNESVNLPWYIKAQVTLRFVVSELLPQPVRISAKALTTNFRLAYADLYGSILNLALLYLVYPLCRC